MIAQIQSHVSFTETPTRLLLRAVLQEDPESHNANNTNDNPLVVNDQLAPLPASSAQHTPL